MQGGWEAGFMQGGATNRRCGTTNILDEAGDIPAHASGDRTPTASAWRPRSRSGLTSQYRPRLARNGSRLRGHGRGALTVKASRGHVGGDLSANGRRQAIVLVR
jgi:hypothetical protein